MQALVDSHIFVNRLDPKDLFRSAYLRKFQKDIPPNALEEDVAKYKKGGLVPAYVTEMMLATYGVH